MDNGGDWQAIVHRVRKSKTQLRTNTFTPSRRINMPAQEFSSYFYLCPPIQTYKHSKANVNTVAKQKLSSHPQFLSPEKAEYTQINWPKIIY